MGWGGVGLCGAPRGEDGVENFHRHAGPGKDGVRQNHVGWAWGPHPSDPSSPAPPYCHL